ncbi:methionyl-tRNA formyltransferase [Novosphingobium sp.]|uniref:methionyl-tRNA formyltransferase n=1 Tax=Novosphingobium sp. TaxID=1874826 RepID=UPI003B51EDBE
MRVVFMGTPDFAVPTLTALLAAGHEVVAVYSQPPRPAGRGKTLLPSPVQAAAERAGVPVYTPASLRGADEQVAFAGHQADVAVVAAYGLILPPSVLALPVHGCLNVHGSILPRWRGAAPVQRAILAGDDETGVTIMAMERGLDTGPMLKVVRTPTLDKTAGELTTELAAIGAQAMVAVLADLRAHPPVVQPQVGVTYAAKIDKAESRLDFAQGAPDVERQVRAFAPAPGAFFEIGDERFRVLRANVVEGAGEPGTVLDDALTIACGTGAVSPRLVQRAGRPAMDTASLLRGYPIAAGARIG